jgi:hypothetical protein
MVLARRHGIGHATQFPQELVDIIIDALHDDTHTLKICSVVCKKWTHRCRIRLLHTITFDLTSPTLATRDTPDDVVRDKFTFFQKFLTSSPGLIRHIRSVELRNLQWRNEKWEDAFGVIASILRSLHYVERLILQNLRWYHCPGSLKDAISSLLQQPTIGHVELSAFAVRERSSLIRLLTYPTNLKVLHMKRIECRDYHRGDERTDEPTALGVRELQALYIDATHCSCLFDWLLTTKSSLNLTGLTTLHISDGCRPVFAERLLRLASPSLEHLELGIGYMFGMI